MNVITAAGPRRRFEMKTFIVTSENEIVVLTPTAEGTVPTGDTFGTQAELSTVAANWPASRLVAIWNGLPGVVAVKKFTDRKTAVHRLWQQVQTLDARPAAETPTVAPKNRAAGKPRRTQSKAATGPENSKSSQVIGLLKRAKGATLAELMETTGWQAHSVRGFISASVGKRMGLTVESSRREDGARFYKISS
jgi:hypothetical protein